MSLYIDICVGLLYKYTHDIFVTIFFVYTYLNVCKTNEYCYFVNWIIVCLFGF